MRRTWCSLTCLREGLDMSDLGDLVTYVRKVLDVRSKSG